MKLHACPDCGYVTTAQSCPACRSVAAKLRGRRAAPSVKFQLAKAKAEVIELKRQVRNLTEAIQEGRAF